ncbi:MAG: hypothetical protein IKB72_02495 [Ruminococcus sp.]|nr:hypothetical protein [Ruminococcus sp.]
MANVFKRLWKLHNSTVNHLTACSPGSEEEIFYQEDLSLLEEIDEYLHSFAWLRKQQTKEKIRVYLDGCFDYNLLCEQFGISYENAKNSVHWCATQFESKIGWHTLKLIEQGYIEEARAAFYIGTGHLKIEQLVTEQCAGELPEPQYDIFRLADCEQELKVLRLVSRATLSEYMSSIDEKKMAYLMYLLKGTTKKGAMLRPYLIALLTGSLHEQDLIAMESEIRKSY